jgi:ABC-type molybdate transport system permease subunit
MVRELPPLDINALYDGPAITDAEHYRRRAETERVYREAKTRMRDMINMLVLAVLSLAPVALGLILGPQSFIQGPLSNNTFYSIMAVWGMCIILYLAFFPSLYRRQRRLINRLEGKATSSTRR